MQCHLKFGGRYTLPEIWTSIYDVKLKVELEMALEKKSDSVIALVPWRLVLVPAVKNLFQKNPHDQVYHYQSTLFAKGYSWRKFDSLTHFMSMFHFDTPWKRPRTCLDNFELLRANTWSLLINIIWQENSIWRVLIWGNDKTSGCFDMKTLSLIFPSSYSVPKVNNKPSQQLSAQN